MSGRSPIKLNANLNNPKIYRDLSQAIGESQENILKELELKNESKKHNLKIHPFFSGIHYCKFG